MLDTCGTGAMAVAYAYPLTWIADAVGRGDRVREFFAHGAEGMPFVDAGREVLADDPIRAAQVLEAAGSLTDAAFARLRAAQMLVEEGRRVEADQQLGNALAFYRSVRATRYIREGEALLAATA